ncbi:MAG TPA: lasso RiPP family leader peptide-containing protein [Mycobacterium sp.]|jgi:hypothetical protein|nr:lasso RiPP family leader peptide-containing protein [Mycobacterium sp.]
MTRTDSNSADNHGGYEPPKVTMHGSLAEVTKANAAGNVTDRSFPSNTPVSDLTFS